MGNLVTLIWLDDFHFTACRGIITNIQLAGVGDFPRNRDRAARSRHNSLRPAQIERLRRDTNFGVAGGSWPDAQHLSRQEISRSSRPAVTQTAAPVPRADMAGEGLPE